MTKAEFMVKQLDQILRFHKYWADQNALDPESFPEVNDVDEWWVQFESWIELYG